MNQIDVFTFHFGSSSARADLHTLACCVCTAYISLWAGLGAAPHCSPARMRGGMRHCVCVVCAYVAALSLSRTRAHAHMQPCRATHTKLIYGSHVVHTWFTCGSHVVHTCFRPTRRPGMIGHRPHPQACAHDPACRCFDFQSSGPEACVPVHSPGPPSDPSLCPLTAMVARGD